MDEHAFLSRLGRLYGPIDGSNAEWSPAEIEWTQLRNRQFGDDWRPPQPVVVRQERQRFLDEILLEPLLAALATDARRRIEAVPVGFLNMRSLNAQAIRSPNGRPVIVLNQGLLALTSFWWEVKAASGVVQRADGPEGLTHYLGKMYSFVLNFYSTNGNEQYPREFVPLPSNVMSRVLKYSIQTEMFVLAHEISHVLAGHLEGADVRPVRMHGVPGADPVDFFQVSHEMEYEADRQGLDLYLRAWPGTPSWGGTLTPLDVVAPLEFFALATLVERNVPDFDRFTTHPSAFDRLLALLGELPTRDIDPWQDEVRDLARELIWFAHSMPDMSDYLVSRDPGGRRWPRRRRR